MENQPRSPEQLHEQFHRGFESKQEFDAFLRTISAEEMDLLGHAGLEPPDAAEDENTESAIPEPSDQD